jgi:hypothetical protein
MYKLRINFNLVINLIDRNIIINKSVSMSSVLKGNLFEEKVFRKLRQVGIECRRTGYISILFLLVITLLINLLL